MGWTLGIAFTTVALLLAWRVRARRATAAGMLPPELARTYTIGGRIEVTNDCSDDDGALPDQVRIRASLCDGGRREAAAEALVTLRAPEPGEADGPHRVGDYVIEVRWSAKSPPVYWKPPRATQTDGSDLCRGLVCPERNHCVNVASRPRRIELRAADTAYTLRVACICVPD
jgi:hypothetical protein